MAFKQRLAPGEQGDAAAKFHADIREAKDNFHAGNAETVNRFHENVDSQGIAKIPDAKTAEEFASRQGRSLSGLLKELPQRKYNEDLNNFKGKKFGGTEKWGRDGGAKAMKSTMSDLYKKAKAAKKNDIFAKAKGSAVAAGSTAVSGVTSELLQKSWLNVIDTWGLTLLYINFHVFCRFVFGPELFCKLGHEWTGGKGTGAVSKSAGAAKGATSGVKSEASSFLGFPLDAIGLAEAALLGLVDLLVIVIIIIDLIPFIIIIWILSDPVGAFWTLSGALFGLLYDALKAITGL